MVLITWFDMWEFMDKMLLQKLYKLNFVLNSMRFDKYNPARNSVNELQNYTNLYVAKQQTSTLFPSIMLGKFLLLFVLLFSISFVSAVYSPDSSVCFPSNYYGAVSLCNDLEGLDSCMCKKTQYNPQTDAFYCDIDNVVSCPYGCYSNPTGSDFCLGQNFIPDCSEGHMKCEDIFIYECVGGLWKKVRACVDQECEEYSYNHADCVLKEEDTYYCLGNLDECFWSDHKGDNCYDTLQECESQIGYCCYKFDFFGSDYDLNNADCQPQIGLISYAGCDDDLGYCCSRMTDFNYKKGSCSSNEKVFFGLTEQECENKNVVYEDHTGEAFGGDSECAWYDLVCWSGKWASESTETFLRSFFKNASPLFLIVIFLVFLFVYRPVLGVLVKLGKFGIFFAFLSIAIVVLLIWKPEVLSAIAEFVGIGVG